MTMRWNWKTASGLAAIVTVAISTGYLMGTYRECLNGTTLCHPDWQAFGAISSAAAVFVALYLAIDNRRKEQNDRHAVAQAMRVALVAELEVNFRVVIGLHKALKAAPSRRQTHDFIVSSKMNFVRPLGESIASHYPSLPQDLIAICSGKETEIQAVINRLHLILESTGSDKIPPIKHNIEHLMGIYRDYLAGLASEKYATKTVEDIYMTLDGT